MKRFAPAALAVALLASNRAAIAQEEDLYFETVGGARHDACAGQKYVCYDLLSTHRPNYFITGFTEAVEAKFQFSVKYNLWPNESPSSVHFGYTQKSLWNVYQASAPFVESNYNPELFYTYAFRDHDRSPLQPSTLSPERERPDDGSPPPVPSGETPSGETRVGCRPSFLRAGVEHESDGLGGTQSRSWNRAYVSGLGGCELSAASYIVFALKVWGVPLSAGDNPDIAKYLGSGELSFAFGASSDAWYGSAEIGATARKGWRASAKAGSVEVDARWRPGYSNLSTSWRFVPYLFGQLFTGYGETLLDYDNPETSVRVGIGLSGAVRLRR